MLQQGFGGSSAQNRDLGGDVRLKSGEPADVPTPVGVQKTETWLGPPHYRKYIATREISTCREDLSVVFTMCYANAHAAIMESTCTELARGPWVKLYREKQRGTVLGSVTISLVSCHITYQPPQADSSES